MQDRDAAAGNGSAHGFGAAEGAGTQEDGGAAGSPQRRGKRCEIVTGDGDGGAQVPVLGKQVPVLGKQVPVLGKDVAGARVDVDNDRASRMRDRQPDGVAGGLPGMGAADRYGGFRDRPAERGLVQPLVADPAPVLGRNSVCDHHHREPVERGVGDAVDGAGKSGSAGDDDGTRSPGEIGIRRGHDGGRRLAVGEDEPQPAVRGGTNEIQVRSAAGHAKEQPCPGRG